MTDRRVFIVGCPRSGTTLVQSMLAAHPEVLSFPETHFFRKIRGRFSGSRANVASPRAARRQLTSLARGLRVEDLVPSVWRLGVSLRAYERAFVDLVDAACVRAGKTTWVEKSPIHLHFVDDITAVAPDARFIHILRGGPAVVASFYKLCLEEPRWLRQVIGGDPVENLRRDPIDHRVLDAVVDRWNTDLRLSAALSGRQGHHIVILEHLLSDPVSELQQMCRFLGLGFHERMLDHTSAAEQVIGWRIRYPHMHGPLQPLRTGPGPGLDTYLSPELVRRVEERLLCGGDVIQALERSRDTASAGSLGGSA